jgi:L-ribulose-5-phosphate 3-epimerase UlaE
MSRGKKQQWTKNRPLRPAEDFGVYDEQLGQRQKWCPRTTQTLELAPGRFVEISFDPSTREYAALSLRGESRLALIDKILDEWLKVETVEEVLGGPRQSPQKFAEDEAA